MTIDQTTIETPPRERKAKRWPWIVGIVVAFIVGAGIGAAGAGDGTEPASTDNSAEISELESQIADLEAERDDALGALSEREAARGDQDATLAEREAELDEREAQLDEREAAVTAGEETVAVNTVTDGIWTVGVDIEPGTYRATNVSAECYWAVLVSGTNGADIVDNGIPGGGNPQVTVSEGQDFETTRCSEWVKQ